MREESLTYYRCPRCSGELRLGDVSERDASEIRTGTLVCASKSCGPFPIDRGIVYLLPDDAQISEIKRRERDGWIRIAREHNALESRDRVLMDLPYPDEVALGEGSGETGEHWRQATMTFPVVMAVMRGGAHDLRGKRILEVGASIGWGARRFADDGAEVVATDFNADPDCGLGKAEFFIGQGAPHFERLCADSEFMPIADATFDFVFCCATIHHFEKPAALMREIARVLKPGGAFLAMNEAFRPALIRSAAEQLGRSRPAQDHLEFGINEQVFTHGEYRKFFEDAGLKFDSVHPRWDAVPVASGADGLPRVKVECGIGLREGGFSLSNTDRSAARRAVNALGLHRLLRIPPVQSATRAALFNFTNSFRVLVGRK